MIMKRAIKYTSFEELKASEQVSASVSASVKKHADFERFIRKLSATPRVIKAKPRN